MKTLFEVTFFRAIEYYMNKKGGKRNWTLLNGSYVMYQMNHIGIIKSIDLYPIRLLPVYVSIDLSRSRDYDSITSRPEDYNTVAVTIIELANNEVMHENTNRLPAHVILENHRMSNRGRLPAANTSGDFTGERRCSSHLM